MQSSWIIALLTTRQQKCLEAHLTNYFINKNKSLPNTSRFSRPYKRKLWKKKRLVNEKMLEASIFSFSYNVLFFVKSKFLNPFLHIYTNFNTLKKKTLRETLWKKVKLLKMSNFTFFHNVFCTICILKSYNSQFQLSSAASLNVVRSQNGVLGNGLSRQNCVLYKCFQFGQILKFCHLVKTQKSNAYKTSRF